MKMTTLSSYTFLAMYSEFYEAHRWYSDSRFEAPMTRLHDGSRVFIGDIVTISDQCYGKVKKFLIEV